MGKNIIAVSVKNETGSVISDIQYRHRYDEDVYNSGHLDVLSENKKKSIGEATFWTGFLRTGLDYWWIQFKLKGKLYTCKANFYCYLTSDDAEHLSKGVELVLTSSKMKVIPPVSSSCKVRLYESDELMQLITDEHTKSGIAEEKQPEDLRKKSFSD